MGSLPTKDTNGLDLKKQGLDAIRSDLFSHKRDIEQFETILKKIESSKLIIDLKLPTIINKEIAEFACGEIRECDNINCQGIDKEISLLLSQISDPTLYNQDDIIFDENAKQFFDDDFLFIYCNQCKNAGHRCSRCDSFFFGQLWQNCYRCRTSICDYCGDDCDNPRCNITYCIGGDVKSFTSGCGERFLSEMECSNCNQENKYCHACDDKYADECAQCQKAQRGKIRQNIKKKIKYIEREDIIYDIRKRKKVCSECNNDPDDNKGRICNGCKLFICGDHCHQYGRFCRGICDTFCCNDCIKKGELNDCHRYECEEMICDECEYKCEGCWDFMMFNGVDDDDIEEALRNGNYSDYFNDDY